MVTGGASVTAVAAAGPGAASAPAGGGCVPPGPDSALPPPRRSGENRRSNKPIMEKRRRARINNCLNELKSLILDAMKKDPARHSKLEKADILEMTVKHLETLQRQQAAMSAATDPAVVNKFRAGFSECAGEVGRFPGLESAVRRRLLQHLANCLNGSTAAAPESAAAPASTPASPAAAGGTPPAPAAAPTAVQVHILQPGSAAGALPAIAAGPNGGIFLATNGGPSLQLVPTRLPNGDIALVLPSANGTFRQSASTTAQSSPSTSPVPSSSSSTSSSSSSASSPLPLLIPVPQRTASTASASSTSSGSSTSSASPVAFDRLSVASPPAPNVRPPSAAPTPAPAHAPSPAVSPAVRDAATSPSAGGPVFQSRPPSRAARTPSPYEVPARPYSPPMQRPLSLVMRKTVDACSDEEKPWRPW